MPDGSPSQQERFREVVVGGKQASDPTLGEVAGWFFARAGGPQAVANLLYEEFTAALPGTLARQRVLDILLRCLKHAEDKRPDAGDLSMLSDDDLVRELTTRLGELHPAETEVAHGAPA